MAVLNVTPSPSTIIKMPANKPKGRHIRLICRLSVYLYLFVDTLNRDAALPIFSMSLPASSSLEMRTRSTLSSFGWLGNCMLTVSQTHPCLCVYFFKEQNVGQMDTRQTCLSLHRSLRPCGHKLTDTCMSAHLLALWFNIKSTNFFSPKCTLFSVSLAPSLISCRI